MFTTLSNKVYSRLVPLRELNSIADWWLFLRILGFAAIAPWLMLAKLQRVATWLAPPRRQHRSQPSDKKVQTLLRYTDLAMRVGSPLVQRRCLTRGLTLYYFLNRAGLPVDLWFSVGKIEDVFTGHCWLVQEDTPFAEANDPNHRYRCVYKMSAQSNT